MPGYIKTRSPKTVIDCVYVQSMVIFSLGSKAKLAVNSSKLPEKAAQTALKMFLESQLLNIRQIKEGFGTYVEKAKITIPA
jgi:hypothetical protein